MFKLIIELILQGSPLRDLLLAENCTVTTCHSKTVDLSTEVNNFIQSASFFVSQLDSIQNGFQFHY